MEIYFENPDSVGETYDRHNRSSEQLIQITIDRFCTTHSLIDNLYPQSRRTLRTEEVVTAVEHSVEETRINRFTIVYSNGNCVCSSYEKFCKKTLDSELTRSSSFKNWSRVTIIVQWVDRKFSQKKKVFSDSPYFLLNGHMNNKIVGFRMNRIHKTLLFGVVYGLVESLAHISSKIIPARTSTKSAI